MTAKIIFVIAIVFFIVSRARLSSGLKGVSGSVCNRTGSEPEPRHFSVNNPPDGGDQLTKPNSGQTDGEASARFLESQRSYHPPQTEVPHTTEYVTKWECCAGYKNVNGTCKPQCSQKCENGDCIRPNICLCNDNWGGHYCNETFACTIVLSVPVNVSEPVNEPLAPGYTENGTENSIRKLERFPQCRLECLNQVHNKDVNTTRWANETYYLIPNESCHPSFLKKYSYAIGGGLGIVLLTVISCIVCLVSAKRKTRIPVEDIPLQTKCPDYMVDNTIYA